MIRHPLEHPDPDVGCRWLCETAGHRSEADKAAIAEAMATLPYDGGMPLHVPSFPLELVR